MINLVLLGRKERPAMQGVVIAGSLLPDLPMFLFYFIEKLTRKSSEQLIWSQNYYLDSWQNFFDLFNSIPLMALGLGLSVIRKSKAGTLLFASMLLHVLGDIFVHHEDAHRHFYPLSKWRFISPVSYWDPQYHGVLLSVLEITAVFVCALVLSRSVKYDASKWMIGLILVTYALYVSFVLIVWM